MTAREHLQQIKKIETQLKNKAFEVKRLEELGLAAEQTEKEIKELEIKRAEIIKTIEQLPEAEYDVLHKIYVQHETLYEVASERDISYRLAASLHGRALKKLDNIINAK